MCMHLLCWGLTAAHQELMVLPWSSDHLNQKKPRCYEHAVCRGPHLRPSEAGTLGLESGTFLLIYNVTKWLVEGLTLILNS